MTIEIYSIMYTVNRIKRMAEIEMAAAVLASLYSSFVSFFFSSSSIANLAKRESEEKREKKKKKIFDTVRKQFSFCYQTSIQQLERKRDRLAGRQNEMVILYICSIPYIRARTHTHTYRIYTREEELALHLARTYVRRSNGQKQSVG